MKFKVRILVHNYVDLSDKGKLSSLTIAADDEDDAVDKLRAMVEAERDANDDICVYPGNGKALKHRYVGAILRSGVTKA